jgi:hypothetical protein
VLNPPSPGAQSPDTAFNVVDGRLFAVKALGLYRFGDFLRAYRARKLKDAPVSRLDAFLFASPKAVHVHTPSDPRQNDVAPSRPATLLACRQSPFRMLARMLRLQVSWSGRLLKEQERTFGSSPSDDHENASSYGTHHQRTGIVINWLAA